MSKELSLKEAEEIVGTLSDDFAGKVKSWGSRTDAERMAIGIIVLSKTIQGKTLRTLESELGIPRTTLFRYKEHALSAIALPTVDAARAEEVDRLDRIVEILWPKVELGDKESIAAYMKVSERRAKILGLDKPVQVEAVIAEVTPEEMELRRLLDAGHKENNVIAGELIDEGEKDG